MKKATHKGHCQACGRLQALPNGMLSNHGYTVQHGFFAGTCRGSGYQPFETGFDQIARYVAEAQDEVARLEAWQADLRQPATVNLAWVRNYEIVDSRGVGGYRWRQVPIDVESHESSGRTWFTFSYQAPGFRKAFGTNEKHDVQQPYDQPVRWTTALEAVAYLNACRAHALQRPIQQLNAYVAWQQERVAAWKPMPLLPVSAKDKLGFAVEAA